MKQKALSDIVLIFLIFSLFSFASSYTADYTIEPQTETPPTKGYMDRLMGRDTDPLGLKENKSFNQLLGQPHIKWVIRSEQRHILN